VVAVVVGSVVVPSSNGGSRRSSVRGDTSSSDSALSASTDMVALIGAWRISCSSGDAETAASRRYLYQNRCQKQRARLPPSSPDAIARSIAPIILGSPSETVHLTCHVPTDARARVCVRVWVCVDVCVSLCVRVLP
jgi:hypothetical protein